MDRKQFRIRLRRVILGGAMVLALGCIFCVLARHGLGIPCLFRHITGLMCPGCGNTRAALSLLQLDIAAALNYNLLFPLEFFYLGWVIFQSCREYLRGRAFSYPLRWKWLDIATLAAVLIWGVVRNLL